MQPSAALASLVNTPMPHGIGLSVMPDGAVVKRELGFPFQFRFTFRGRRFEAVAYDHGETVHIRATTIAGVIPYSQEDVARRADILQVFDAIGGHGDAKLAWHGLGWYVDAHQRIHAGLGVNVLPEAKPTSVLADLIHGLLPHRGWFALLDVLCHPPANTTPPLYGAVAVKKAATAA